MGMLEDLPDDILISIASYLTSRDVIRLSACSSRLYALFFTDNYWKSRIPWLWKVAYPPLPGCSMDWCKCITARQTAYRLWSGRFPHNVQKASFSHGLCQGIDAIHLMKDEIVIVGGRDRYFSVYSTASVLLEQAVDPVKPLYQDSSIHTGWVWDIASQGTDNILTCCWDQYLRRWKCRPDTVTCVRDYRMPSSVLCSCFLSPNEAVVGLFGRVGILVDFRIPDASMSSHRKLQCHTKSILSTTVLRTCNSPSSSSGAGEDTVEDDPDSSSSYFCTSSEDKLLALWDLRRLAGPVDQFELPYYSQSISSNGCELWVGDRGGNVSLFNCQYGKLELINSMTSPHGKCAIVKMHADTGCIVIVTLNGSVQAFHPTTDLMPLGLPLLEGPNGSAISLSKTKRSVAVGSSQGVVTCWSAIPEFYE